MAKRRYHPPVRKTPKNVQSMAVRFLLYGLVLVYLGLDLFLFKGPVWHKVQEVQLSKEAKRQQAISEGIVARAYAQPIFQTQVDWAVAEGLFREGRDIESASEEELKWRRTIATEALLDEALLRNKIQHNQAASQVSEERVDEELRKLTARFTDSETLETALEGQGIEGLAELKMRAAARLEQLDYLESRISEAVQVSEEEIGDFHTQYVEKFRVPEQVRVRHIFFASLKPGAAEAKARADYAASWLRAGANFDKLAEKLSDDLQTKDRGGELGWIAKGRGEEKFVEAVLGAEVGSIEIVETGIGAHVFQVQERQESRLPELAEVREEIRAALESERRDQALDIYKRQLRGSAGEHREFYKDPLER